ncbi:MAG TPA: PQQ-dependent sugar dehydrogenase [Pyrinomonadaceae bacterium]|nr:PQQ-dependent sugar dehydrogenase [Pyrinomonadaceae bacterium]
MNALLVRLTAAAISVFASAVNSYGQAPPAAPPPDVVTSSAGNIRVERLATLEFPWGLALLPDGRLLVTEKPGRLRVWAGGKLSEPLQGVPSVVNLRPGEQGGLLDVKVDPDFARNGFVYLSYSEAAEQQSSGVTDTGDMRFGRLAGSQDNVIRGGAVARARLVGDRLTDLQVIWRQTPKTVGRGHFGNRMAFGPDGKLYIASGDRMRFEPAQNPASNLGKVVRINTDGSVPADNPFVGREGARDDVWSLGHRNILSLAFDSAGRLWAFEMGPLGGDEVNLVAKGENYGWPLVSNGDNYNGRDFTNPPIPDHPTRREFREPVRTWTPVVSPSGSIFYSGSLFQGWRGSALVGGLSSQAIVRLGFDGGRIAIEERINMGRRVRDLIQAPDGSLYVIVDAEKGDLLRLSPAAQR